MTRTTLDRVRAFAGCGDSSDRTRDFLFCVRPDASNPAVACRAIPTARHLRGALLLAAAVPLAAATAAAVLAAGHWQLYADRHRIEITARPRTGCPRCHGAGGRWVGGAFPEMEACGCWSDRREFRVRLLPLPTWPDQPPF